MSPIQFIAAVVALAGLALGTVLTANAQPTEAEMRFLSEILDASKSENEETARAAHAKCVALSKRLDAMTGIAAVQRLYYEAEIEKCISYAMNNGRFSDATGDACSHHYAFASKLAQVIEAGSGQPGFMPGLMSALGDSLKSATNIGPTIGCTSDYRVFEAAIALAETEAAKPPPAPPFKLWDDINNAARGFAPKNAREVQKTCLAFSGQIAAKPDLPAAERLFYEGMIENCVARAMEAGKYSDESGNACDHHFRFAQKYAEGAAAGKNDPRFAEMIVRFMREEVKVAQRQGPKMGCKQDYGSLKAE